MNCSRSLRRSDRCRVCCSTGHFFGQEKVAGQLLRDRACAFQIRPVAEHVREERADDSNRIDAGMRVIPLIFDGEHGFDHRARAAPTSGTCRRLTRAWISAVSIGASIVTRDKRLFADRQRLDAIADRRGRLRTSARVAGPAAGKLTMTRLAGMAAGARHDADQRRRSTANSPGFCACVRCAYPRSLSRSSSSFWEMLSPRRDLQRARKHARQHAIAFAVQARVDHPREA